MIAALIPAAGLSSRMGGDRPKPLLPWGRHTVIEQVVTTLQAAGLSKLIVVSGHRREQLEAALTGRPVRCVYNEAYRRGDMLSSLQTGLRALPVDCSGALLALADQPMIRVEVVRQVMQAFAAAGRTEIVIPSHNMRRGHPILLPRRLWPEVLALTEGDSLRSVIRKHPADIRYALVDSPDILADIDTPSHYQAALLQYQQT